MGIALRTLRYNFWKWAHGRTEALWHWIYYHKLEPVTPKDHEYYSYNVVYLADGKIVAQPSPTHVLTEDGEQ